MPGSPEAIAATYDTISANQVLGFAGASEGIFARTTCSRRREPCRGGDTQLPEPRITALAICHATGVPLDPDDGWSLDVDRVAAAVRPNTKLVTINFPHNPTGAILDRERYDALIELCRHHGLHLLHDEIFHGLGPTGTEHLPFVADVYEKGCPST